MTQIEYVIFKFLILLDVCWETKKCKFKLPEKWQVVA